MTFTELLAKSGHGSFARLYRQQNELKPKVLIRVSPAADGWTNAFLGALSISSPVWLTGIREESVSPLSLFVSQQQLCSALISKVVPDLREFLRKRQD